MQQITKIKAKPGDPVEVRWTEDEDKGKGKGKAKYHLECSQAPRPELYGALDALTPYVAELLLLPPEYQIDMTITGVTFSYGGDEVQVVVTALKALESCKSPLVLNTPLAEISEVVSGMEVTEAFTRILEEARHYKNGDRAQADLFAGQMVAATIGPNNPVPPPPGMPEDRKDEGVLV